MAKGVGVIRSRSRSPQSPIQRNGWDWEIGTSTENWTPRDGSDSSNGDISNDPPGDLLAAENTKSTKVCTQESRTDTHTSQATCTPSSSRITTDMKWRALTYMSVGEFLKLDIIHGIIENLNEDEVVDIMKQALNIDDLDFTVQKRTQYEVLCTSQKQRIDSLNHHLRIEGAEILEIKEDTKQFLRNELYHFCVRNPEKKSEMLRNQLRQVSTLKVFNVLGRQIWRLSAEMRDKLGDDAIQYHKRRHEADSKYYWPLRWDCL